MAGKQSQVRGTISNTSSPVRKAGKASTVSPRAMMERGQSPHMPVKRSSKK